MAIFNKEYIQEFLFQKSKNNKPVFTKEQVTIITKILKNVITKYNNDPKTEKEINKRINDNFDPEDDDFSKLPKKFKKFLCKPGDTNYTEPIEQIYFIIIKTEEKYDAYITITEDFINNKILSEFKNIKEIKNIPLSIEYDNGYLFIEPK